MSTSQDQLQLASAPFVRREQDTTRVMWEVIAALVPVIAVSLYFFGLSALLVLSAAVAGAVGAEWLFIRNSPEFGSIRDGSGVLTGLLLGLTLPPAIPLWMAFLGGAVGMVLGKLVWGGLGQNVFNPALVGRAFLQAAFPVVMTTWTAPSEGFFDIGTNVAIPLMHPSVDVVTSATPLGLAKFQDTMSSLFPMLMGNTSGSLGETSCLVLIACGVWLAVRKIFDWRLMVATLVGVALFSGAIWIFSSGAYPGPLFMLFGGGLMFGAVFMVTDPVTTPITTKGAWIFGLGVGFLVVLLRLFGGLPESVMYSILLMNAMTPLINKYTQPRRFGGATK